MQALEILWIVLFRFRWIPRIWAIHLIAVNLAALAFLDTRYGAISAVCSLLGVGLMIWIHSRLGFVRLLGIGHIFWIPMLVDFSIEPPDAGTEPALYFWVVLLMVSNTLSLILDTVDGVRYWRGERQPHYVW